MWTLRRMMMGVRFSLQMWICQIPMPMHRASGKEKESGYVWCVGDIVVVIVAVIVSLSVPPSSVGHEEKNYSHQGHGALADMHCGWQATPYTYIYVQIPGDHRLATHSKRYSELVCIIIIIVGGEVFLRPLQPLFVSIYGPGKHIPDVWWIFPHLRCLWWPNAKTIFTSQ